jgi:hypothetical protein
MSPPPLALFKRKLLTIQDLPQTTMGKHIEIV